MQIFVGNFASNATVNEVRWLFEPYGEVTNGHLLEDRETGRRRGFGFVEMSNDTQARAAIAGLHGANLGGRMLTMNEARPREVRDGSRGGPRRGPRW